MNKPLFPTWLVLCALGTAGAAIARGQQSPEWKAGVASVVVTPQESIWMAGFASRNKPSEGVEADLHVKALALQDRAGKVSVIVTSDLVALRRHLTDIIAARCQKEYGLTRDRLLLNASHTHSGPTLGLAGGPAPSVDPQQRQVIERYTARLLDQIVDVVGRAIKDLSPATLHFDQGLAGFAVNRRRSRPHTRHLPGPVDHDVPVLAVRAPDGKLRAVLFGYACHATTMAAYRINADYPGYAQSALEKMYPGAIALFVQGCGADANPLPRDHGAGPAMVERGLELCRMYGSILANSVDLVLRGKMTPVTGPIRSAFEYVDIPFEPTPTREELQTRLKSGDGDRKRQAERLLKVLDSGETLPSRYPYGVQVYMFGSGLKLIALTGEVVADYSLRLKAAYGWDDTWVAGYSNDVPGYIPSRRVQLEGGYETMGAAGGSFSTAMEEVIVEKVDVLVKRTRPDPLR